MDPMACLKALDEALYNKDRDDVFEYAWALMGWIEGGGLNPFDDRIGVDWRASFTRSELKAYLNDLISACGEME